MLRRNDSGLVLTVPWIDHDSPYERWFGSGISWGDDPERTLIRYEPPQMLWFVSPDGSIGLVDCYDLGSRARFAGTGEGTIGIRMAVHGAATGEDYRGINGMQSTVPGLGLWLGKHSLERTAERDADGWLSRLNLSWSREDPIKVSRKLNLSLQRGFEFQDVVPDDQSLLEDRFRVQTLVTDSRPWVDHLDLHMAIRDLVALASWSPFELRHLSVTRHSDPARTLDGKAHGRQWLAADVFAYPANPQSGSKPSFLFDFEDIGPVGINRWLKVRHEHLRSIQPLVFSLRQSGVPLETHLMQVGAAVEALGYDLALDAGVSNKRAKDQLFDESANRVLEFLEVDLPATVRSWPDDLRRAYRNVKHAEHPLPAVEEAFHLLQMSRLILRLWLAKRLGVDAQLLLSRARQDRMGRHVW
jgi:hypothetical protein